MGWREERLAGAAGALASISPCQVDGMMNDGRRKYDKSGGWLEIGGGGRGVLEGFELEAQRKGSTEASLTS